MFYFARCMNIIFNSLLAQLVEYDLHTTRKIKSIHAILSHIIISSGRCASMLNKASIVYGGVCVRVCLCVCVPVRAKTEQPAYQKMLQLDVNIYLW